MGRWILRPRELFGRWSVRGRWCGGSETTLDPLPPISHQEGVPYGEVRFQEEIRLASARGEVEPQDDYLEEGGFQKEEKDREVRVREKNRRDAEEGVRQDGGPEDRKQEEEGHNSQDRHLRREEAVDEPQGPGPDHEGEHAIPALDGGQGSRLVGSPAGGGGGDS